MKKYLLSLSAVAIAFALFAFGQPQKIKTVDPLWYYTLSTTAGHSFASNYEPLNDQDEEALCPGETLVRCVIEAPTASGGGPDLTNMIVRSFKP